MEGILKNLKGKTVDIAFGATATVRGEIANVKDGVIELLDDEKKTVYVAVDKVAVVRESDDNQSRPGFLG